MVAEVPGGPGRSPPERSEPVQHWFYGEGFGGFELDVLVYGSAIKEYLHEGRTYVEGRKGSAYSLQFHNHSARRLLAVITVDGLSVMDGKTGNYKSSGYVVDGFSSIVIPGWRLNDETVAQFLFSTTFGESYAAQMGKPTDVGVIGCAVFYEKPPVPVRPDYYFMDEPNVTRRFGEKLRSVKSTTSGLSELQGRAQNIGTGFGHQVGHRVVRVRFDKATETPNAVLTIYYDDREGLKAKGIDLANRPKIYDPNPFPGQSGCVPPPGWRG